MPPNRCAPRRAGATRRAGFRPPAATSACARIGPHLITASGLDKGTLTPAGLLEVDLEGRVVGGEGSLRRRPGCTWCSTRRAPRPAPFCMCTRCGTRSSPASMRMRGHVAIGGYELLKGLSGVDTHEHVEQVPILKNSQNYAELTAQLAGALKEYPDAHGVLLSRHGLYTWGESVAEARRHLEALEFLFEVEGGARWRSGNRIEIRDADCRPGCPRSRRLRPGKRTIWAPRSHFKLQNQMVI
jgi:methylthioribulose-1-phosphate dehydratase